MNRRATLASLLGQKATARSLASNTSAAFSLSGLTPYMGSFGYEQAAHLLRRTTFGATYQQIKDTAAAGLDATIEQLFAEQPMPSPPLNFNFANDPYVPIGETWVDQPTDPAVNGLQAYRSQSIRAWTLDLMRSESISLREKMTLFWHNHYVTADINDPRFVYRYITLLRQNALGNFRELTKLVNVDPAMLRYLNGNENTANAPNENYARELLELFTIGKGPQIAPGDYTNYTEDDVVEMAKVLSGWRAIGVNTTDPAVPIQAQFFNNRHNQTTKQLSYHFDSVQIPNMGATEHEHLVDIIFTKQECARFLCRKLYRWFVYYVIDEQVENEVILPMAQIMLDNDYEVRPALEALLRSEHFFDILNVGPMIKNPADFVLNVLKIFEVDMPANNLNQFYRIHWQLFRTTFTPMQMTYFDPPSVAGWKAYYQEPIFYRNWISAVTLSARQAFTDRMATEGISSAGFTAKVDVLKFVATIDDPLDPNHVVEEFVKILFPQPITQFQHDFLKLALLDGLPEYVWGEEYAAYLDNPNDPTASDPVEAKLKKLLTAMLGMPEFHLS